MFFRKSILFYVLLIVSFTCNVNSEPTSTSLFPSPKEVTAQMDALMEKSDLPALVAIAINKVGEQIEYTYGNAVWEENTPILTSNIFRIASMTKLLTSIAALQLVEKGDLELEEDLAMLMPEMASIPILTDDGTLVEGNNPITLRDLLTHSSGFGYTSTDAGLAKFDRTNWAYEDLPRRFESGTQFLYGTSTDWVGKIIEKVSGVSLEEYFRKNITGPLGMNHTWFNVPENLQDKIVSFGGRGEDGTQALEEYPDRVPKKKRDVYSGGGGLFSSPEDYNRLLFCLLNDGQYDGGKLLEKATIDEMFSPQLENISMDVTNNHFRPGGCCDLKGIVKSSSNWGLSGLIDTEATAYGRKEGALLWGGLYNTYWYIDRKSGVAASIYTQYLPFNHPNTTTVFDQFSAMIYANYKEK